MIVWEMKPWIAVLCMCLGLHTQTSHAQILTNTQAEAKQEQEGSQTGIQGLQISQFPGECSPDLMTYDVSLVISGGSGNYSVDAAGYVVVDESESFLIENIPVWASNVTVYIEDLEEADSATEYIVIAPECECPDIPTPIVEDVEYCQGDQIPMLSVLTPTSLGFTYQWFADWSGPQIASGDSFQPPAPGHYILYQVEDDNGCMSMHAEVSVTEIPALQITQTAIECANDLTTYSTTLEISGGSGDYAVLGTSSSVVSTGDSFLLPDIPVGEDIIVYVEDTNDSVCTTEFLIQSPNCDCPDIPMPLVSGVDYCEGDAIPELATSSPAGYTCLWYDEAGFLLAQGDAFQALSPGTFMAVLEEDVNGCNSAAVQVIISEIPFIQITQTSAICSEDLTTYTAEVTFTGGTGVSTIIDAGPFNVTDEGGDIFTLQGLPLQSSTPIVVTVYDLDCSSSIELFAPDCDCLDPGNCDDEDCSNGLEQWDADSCECVSGPAPVDPGCNDGDCDNGIEIWDGCECVIDPDPNDTVCDDGICSNGVETWNGCECETIPSIPGCTNSAAANYDPEANCNDGSCVMVANEPTDIRMPNAFSPNGDGINDLFRPLSSLDFVDADLLVFDRYGHKIFEGPCSEGWDGRSAGKAVATGQYQYIIHYSDKAGARKFKAGSLTLLR